MSKYTIIRLFTATFAFVLAGFIYAQSQTVDLTPAKDNTLYENPNGSLSNGAGEYFFAGKTNAGSIRRGVLAFDITASIPANATIEDVILTLNMSKTISGSADIALHRLTSDWGEGTSDANGEEGGGAPATTGDATWIHTFFNSSQWSNAGGDFSATASATQSVGADGQYTWQSPQLNADVQDWLTNPAGNFGWIVIGDEENNASAKRFDTRENGTTANRPKLTVTYNVTTGIGDDDNTAVDFQLAQNYPNPFNPATQIRFSLNRSAQTTLTVFNAVGQEVATLVNGILPAGSHKIMFDATNLVSGLYFYQLKAGQKTETRKMILMK